MRVQLRCGGVTERVATGKRPANPRYRTLVPDPVRTGRDPYPEGP
ncbi:hypothetical protein SSCG_02098 [Streptomyces clavuligerus]|nr:hypothetical protein SSCG_02098 [Streptomyces clavuligerus]